MLDMFKLSGVGGMARVLIAGCGDVGITLGLILTRSGHQVWGLRRNPDNLPAPIRPLAADLTVPGTLTALPPALDYIFYTAAADGFDEARYRAAYVEGVRHLLAALEPAGSSPQRIFFTSSTSVYAQQQGEWVDEASPAEAKSFAGRCLRQGETILWEGPYPTTVIRFGGLYGPGRTRLIDTLRNGTATCVPGVYTNRIHRDDAAAALRYLMDLSEPGDLYLGVDDEPALQCEVMAWLAERLGVAGPVQVEADRPSRANKRCRNARLRASGFRFRYPSYRDGYEALLAAGD